MRRALQKLSIHYMRELQPEEITREKSRPVKLAAIMPGREKKKKGTLVQTLHWKVVRRESENVRVRENP